MSFSDAPRFVAGIKTGARWELTRVTDRVDLGVAQHAGPRADGGNAFVTVAVKRSGADRHPGGGNGPALGSLSLAGTCDLRGTGTGGP